MFTQVTMTFGEFTNTEHSGGGTFFIRASGILWIKVTSANVVKTKIKIIIQLDAQNLLQRNSNVSWIRV